MASGARTIAGICWRPSVVRRPAFRGDRRGAAVVEFAVILPLLLLLVIGAIEVGRATMVQHKLVQAARAGCRLYALENEVTEADVQDIIKQVMDDAGLDPYTVELDPASASGIEHLEPVTVSVSVPFDQVSWSPSNWFLSGKMLTGACVMPGDTGEISGDDGRAGGGWGEDRDPWGDDDDDDHDDDHDDHDDHDDDDDDDHDDHDDDDDDDDD